MRYKISSVASLVLALLVAGLLAAPAEAQFGPIRLPSIPAIPGGDANAAIQQQASSFLTQELAKELQADPPLLLDQSNSLSQVPGPANFQPTKLTSQADLNRPLPPGDYSVNVNFFCTKYSIHRGGQGVPYKLGRAQGRLVKPMCALLNRGSLQGIDPATLNAEAWRMQDGIPLGQWPAADQALVHKLIPEYENDLQGDYIQKIQHDYDTRFGPVLHKSFDQQMASLGDLGQQVLTQERARQLLANQSISDDQLPDMLYQQTGQGGNPVLAANGTSTSPWMAIQPGVIGRFTNTGGYLKVNLLELRIGAGTSASGLVHNVDFSTDGSAGPTLGQILGMDGDQTNLIGYPIGQASQDPLITPILTPVSGPGQGSQSGNDLLFRSVLLPPFLTDTGK